MRRFLLSAAIALLAVHGAHAGGAVFKDPLEVPAPLSRLLTTAPLSAVAMAGTRAVAVGVRGMIITSDDGGASWTQRQAPVSSDLLAVQFPTPQKGWAVGHDGVVLHSGDGGNSWVRQLDGRQAGVQLIAHFKALAAKGDAGAARMLEDMQLNYANGPEQALLDVWFDDEQHGMVCGSFGTLLSTSDGGKTWVSRIEQIEYDGLLHLNALRSAGGNLYLASERGIVFRFDRDKQRFLPSQTGYAGSFFALQAEGDTVVAAGLRGNAYRSIDAGKTWDKLDTGVMSALTGAAGSAGGGKLLLVSQAGNLIVSDDAGSRFRAVPVPRPTMLSGVVLNKPDSALVVGIAGVQQVSLK